MLYYSSLFTSTQSFLNLRNFVANLALLRLRAFWGALLAEIWWRGAQKHLGGPGLKRRIGSPTNCNAFTFSVSSISNQRSAQRLEFAVRMRTLVIKARMKFF